MTRILSVAVLLAVLAVQAIFISQSLFQIRAEELAESVRDVFWLRHRLVYDGNSNVGWYAILLLVYETVGFTLHTAKWVRLCLQALALVCAWRVLRRFLSPLGAAVPLITFALSPTALYFHTLQTPFGTDLSFFPICAWLALCAHERRHLVLQASLWLVAMIACLSYPTFLFYLPALVALQLWLERRARQERPRRRWFGPVLSGVLAFATPLLVAIVMLRNRPQLIADAHTGAGLFHGGGRLDADPRTLGLAVLFCLHDVLVKAQSFYYFELPQPDFTSLLGVTPFALTVLASLLLVREQRSRGIVLIAWSLIGCHLLLANLSASYPGIRRCSGFLAGVYVLFTVLWHRAADSLSRRHPGAPLERSRTMLAAGALCLCLLLPLHHVLAVPANLAAMGKPSYYAESLWFGVRPSAEQSLAYWLERTRSTGLVSHDAQGRPVTGYYSLIFSAIAGYRLWNGLEQPAVLGYDAKTRQFLPLSVDLWQQGYFDL